MEVARLSDTTDIIPVTASERIINDELLTIGEWEFLGIMCSISAVLVGIIVSFLVSLLAIKLLMDFVKRHSFSIFGVYRIILGLVVLGYFAILA